MNKKTTFRSILLIGIILFSVFVIFKNIYEVSNVGINSNDLKEDSLEGKSDSEIRNENTIKKYECFFDSNASWTRCVLEKLDRASAEREWKQRKLETIRHPQINVNDMVTNLKEEQQKMRRWRVGFEESRDAWCEAEDAFIDGSGSTGGISQCKLDFEIMAINDLNNLYYGVIFSETNIYIVGSEGIPDFEPTEEDINRLVESNLTKAPEEY